ncbi:MAG: serine hydrolase [Chryseolinea sp.]
MKYSLLAIAVLCSFAINAQKTIPEKQIREFDNYINQVMKEWEVPGLSITVVKDGKVLLTKGYGVRELGQPGAVDAHTLFACASTTKAMTATVLGMLVDEGKLSWDDPVTKYIPELRLYDPYVTRELRVRDLLLHNTGLASTDYFSSVMDITVSDILKKLVLVKPAYSFRAGYEYQNTMYTLAGLITERVAGKKWSDVMTERLFKPLGMTETVPTRSLSKSSNMTKPHFPVKGEKKILNYLEDSEIGAAGGVWSSAQDITKWVVAMLDSGKYAGGRLVKKETFIEMFKPQTIFPSNEYPTLSILKPNWLTYGFGWYQHDYKGKKINFHTGSLPGLTAIIGLIPEENFGVYIFGNYDHAEVRHALMYMAFDWFALGGTRDWNAEFKKLYGSIRKKNQDLEAAFEKDRVANTKTTLKIDAYAGSYTSELYGKVEIIAEEGKLKLDINNKFIVVDLPHWHYDTFHGPMGEAGQYDLTATFWIDAAGKVSSLDLSGLTFTKTGQ